MPNLKINPPSVLLAPGQSVRFTVTDDTNTPIPAKWTLNPQSSPGSVAASPDTSTPSVTFVASPVPQPAQTIAIIATTDTDSASATISLTPDPISIIPGSVDLKINDRQQFIAIVASPSNPPEQIEWLLSPPAGDISADGLYTAPGNFRENSTISVIAANRRLGSRAVATVNLVSAPWRGVGVVLLGIYLFLVFSVVFLIIALWPLQSGNPEVAKTNRVEAQSALAQRIGELQAAGSGTRSSNSTTQPKSSATGPAPGSAPGTKSGGAQQGSPDQTGSEANTLLLEQLQESVDAARRDLEKRKAEEDEANSKTVRTRMGSDINREIDLLWLVLLAGSLGSFLHLAQSYSDFTGNRTLKSSWVWWYAFRPFVGSALALVFYAAMRGGLVTIVPASSTTAADLNAYGLVAASALVGMFSKSATTKLGEVFDILFQSDKARQTKDKLLPGSQAGAQAVKAAPDSGTSSSPVAK